jgi:phospholipid/cholesterol/gamma-HCH transport system substrate-binding protein
MPSQQEVKWSQLKVGIIVMISVLLLCALLFLMTSTSGMGVFTKKLVVTTYFQNSGGLKTGAPVELEGVTIGEVTHVVIVTDPARKLTPVKLVMKLDPRYHSDLRKDSLASLATIGVLGDTVVDISSETATGPELQTGDELKTVNAPNLQDVVKASQGTIESVNLILAKLDKIAADLNSGKGSAGKLLRDDALYDHLNDTAAKLDKIATQLSGGKGSAGKLLTDDQLYDNLNGTLAHANSLLAEADAGKGSLGILIKDPAFANKLTATVDKLDLLLGNVNSGKGTLGKLATDDAAYTNLNKLLTSSTDLVTAIRADPKKYLTIHMRIF